MKKAFVSTNPCFFYFTDTSHSDIRTSDILHDQAADGVLQASAFPGDVRASVVGSAKLRVIHRCQYEYQGKQVRYCG